MRKIAQALLLIIGIAAGMWAGLRKPGPHYRTERRAWKDGAVAAIEREFVTPPDAGAKDGEWLTTSKIVCADGSWLAYRSQCHKADPKIHDIFVAKASDGRWYYSDYHFCIGALVLAMNGQPETLEKFKSRYFLVEFDGSSNAALSPTWQKAP
jgi:hypothetical protein